MITHIKTDGNEGSAIFNTSDLALVNLLRRAILQEIETYAIEYVIFDVNNSPLHDDKLALLMGQLVIDYNEFERRGLHLNLDTRYEVDIKGNRKFLSTDIKGLPIKSLSKLGTGIPIAELEAGKRLKCSVIVRKNIGREHVKWRPVGLVSVTQINNGYFVSRLNVNDSDISKINETHYIDSVIIYENTTTIGNEFLATTIAKDLKIDYAKFNSNDDIIELDIDKKGPGSLISSNEVFTVPFKFYFDIANILEYQNIRCKIIIKRGKRDNYIRWKSFEHDYPSDTTGFQIKLNNIGMLTTEQIFDKAYDKIRVAASRADTPTTFFFKVRTPKVIPEDIPL